MAFSVDFQKGRGLLITYDAKRFFDEQTHFVFENEDRSIREQIVDWQPDQYEETETGLKLSGVYASPGMETLLEITAEYAVIGGDLIKKTLSLHQPNIPVLFYQLAHVLKPVKAEKLWSFDNPSHQGGIVHGTYPAAGFTDEVSFGLLSDGGHRNLFTRNVRRRPGPRGKGFIGMRRMPDAAMLTLSKEEVVLRLGSLYDFDQGEKKLLDEKTHPFGGLYHAYPGEDGFYTLSFSYRAQSPLHIRVLKEHPQSEVRAFHYQDDIPAGGEEWLTFSDTFFLSDTEGKDTLIRIWQGEGETVALTDIRLQRHMGREMPYHPLKIGQTQVKTTFIFAEKGDDIRSLRLSSQVKLAEGLGFKGSVPAKVLYADMQMLTWITGERDFTPLNVPSINYAPDMYNRDCFWSVMGVNDAALSKALFDRWGNTQTRQGGIGTIVTPMMGSVEVKDNEATCEWLWWALVNQRLYGIQPPEDQIRLAFDYCVRAFDEARLGICHSHFVLGQNDVTTYPDKKTTDLCVNQGMWAATLKVAKALGLHTDDMWIKKAVEGYRAFYDVQRGYMVNDRLHPDTISFNDLLPEFVSLWLFDEKMLDDEMVVNTLEKVPREGAFGFLIGHVRDRYFTDDTKPCDGHFVWPNGVYYNGASWMREEICAYAAGIRHGWQDGQTRIRERMQAEIDVKWDEPFSHEFIPTDLSVPGCWWPSTRVFCWNVFALTACRVGGMEP